MLLFTKRWFRTSLILASIFVAVAAVWQQFAAAQEVKQKTFKYASPEVQRLEMYEGPWQVTEHHFDDRGREVIVKGTEEIRWVLDRRAVERTYTTSSDTTVYRAMSLLTYNDVAKTYQGVWLDNVSTSGPSTATGEWNNTEKTMTWSIESTTPKGEKATYRVIEKFPDANHRVGTTFVIKGNEVFKRLVVEYTRTIPCPSKRANMYFGG